MTMENQPFEDVSRIEHCHISLLQASDADSQVPKLNLNLITLCHFHGLFAFVKCLGNTHDISGPFQLKTPNQVVRIGMKLKAFPGFSGFM